ncbi:galactokinase [Butyrivibrio sp. INlla16]|nr:galactokinase [Butyrivibrio sp. INlla16]
MSGGRWFSADRSGAKTGGAKRRMRSKEGHNMEQKMKDAVLRGFEEQYGKNDSVKAYFAPGRVNLIGEHTDYNGGHVFPCALTIGTYGAAAKRNDRKMRFFSMNFDNGKIIEASLDDLEKSRTAGWTAYPVGVVWAFEKRGLKLDTGFDMIIYGNIPNGSGLSSSASLEVLTGFILRDLYGFDVTNQDLALIGQYSENNFNGCNCGIMDQFASAMGKEENAIFLDTADLSFEYAPIKLDGAKIIISNTNKKHKLTDSAYNARRSACEKALSELQTVVDIKTLGDLTEEEFEAHKDAIKDDDRRIKAKHAVYENQRTIEAVAALKAGDLTKFGELMKQSHISLRDDYDVTGIELDTLAEEAWKIPGVIGSRMTGGGFGGCTVSIVKDEAVEEFKKKVGKAYREKIGYDATFYTVSIGGGPAVI